ncbi:MAG TPA: phosphoglycerate dehydrogenase [Amaricoccus sp.]|uniref:phosphoglycerate dehydrogenase n=1 Tax=Amaricoccus sp. TaxID=1872485 RepID=UPI001D5BFC6C|nr:phosphoglycerate dehydrogenase [Amaricoccus sp.]MCB1373181.1 phosphoglycerate dehydrogenase [Paracoccaceae bacterium]HPG22790.1 phosphoglycerate dehydrogenase [Amaricoccus sp.]HRW13724.1 phosphoglycerate dehydrogenase [Amaricoccus sp.]
MPKVLISDELSDAAVQIFRDRGVEVDFQPKLGKDPERLAAIIGDYDGLAIRSATKVTGDLIARAERLRVIGRAGIGVDNVDIAAASARGIVVMNTPFGNSITTAEHAIGMMFAVARQIPAADASTRAGKWEKSRFMGVEISGKTLGLIGAGNIGSVVASRAIGLKMRVIAHDPFLSAERALAMGVERIEDLDELLARADFISLHLPKTEKTANILSAERIARIKPGARLINCARGGLVDEAAVAAALKEGRLAAAAFDVFAVEPAVTNVLFDAPNVVCTPHLGASTTEAQENVALHVAEQMADYLVHGAISNALNAPSVTAEEAPILKPWIALAEMLGSFAGQVTEHAIEEIEIEYVGEVGDLNLTPLTAALTAGLLRPLVGEGAVNMVSAPLVARERGIHIAETRKDAQGAFGSYIRLIVTTEHQTRSVAGTIYSDGKPRFIQIKGIGLEAEPMRYMLYTTNTDTPGYIGALGTKLGALGVNIATFALGRAVKSGEAIALLGVDEAIGAETLSEIAALPQVRQAKALAF